MARMQTEWTDDDLTEITAKLAYAMHLVREHGGPESKEVLEAMTMADDFVHFSLTKSILAQESEAVLQGEMTAEDHLETLKRIEETGRAI